jgi:hypothetical protein
LNRDSSWKVVKDRVLIQRTLKIWKRPDNPSPSPDNSNHEE